MLIVPGTKFIDKVSNELLTVSAAVGGVVFCEEHEGVSYKVGQIEIIDPKKKVICIMGKSGSGKSTIEKKICKEFKCRKGISHTSRPMREGEVDGRDYHYVTLDEFEKMSSKGLMLEETRYNGWAYGLHAKELVEPGSFLVLVCNPDGYRQILEKLGPDAVLSFYIDVSDKNRLLRALNREIDPDCYEIARRLIGDTKDFEEIEILADYTLSNDGSSINEVYEFVRDVLINI